ncbi:MAG: hypothetical protein ACLPKI_10735 [Streptosporangiaceae bacterium]
MVERDFTHDMADLLIHEPKRQLPRLEKQPAPVRDQQSATSFHD